VMHLGEVVELHARSLPEVVWRPHDDGSPVLRVIYVSRSQRHGSIYDEMVRIRTSALRNNEREGVATALLHQSGWFVQWKEGPREALLRVMSRVELDRRHHGICLVHSSRGPRQLAGPWSMAIVQCADPPEDMAARLEELRRDFRRGRQHAPAAVWRRLSTPLRHPGAARQCDPDAFQRVLVCAAEGTASFTLVDWLAREHGEQVVHRRFAGARNLDVGTDYVDFVDGGRVLRVIAMARRGLALPLTRAFLPDYTHIVLLLSGERESDLSLVGRVVHGCAGLTSPPRLLGVAQDPVTHREVFASARASGFIYLDVTGNVEGRRQSWLTIRPHLDGCRNPAGSHWRVPPIG
jgi:hypothetical protein